MIYDLFKIENLRKEYSNSFLYKKDKTIVAVDNVSFTIKENEIFGLVGESGCGKSTLGRNILMMDKPTSGSVFYKGEQLNNKNKKQLLPFKRKMQIIYQDSYASFNPKRTIKQIIEEPLIVCTKLSETERKDIIYNLIRKVGLNETYLKKLPHELSGGQKQRVGIARAISINPEFIVCDEPVSALDVSIQGQVLNMLKDLKKEYCLTYLFIGHDLPVIYNMADRVAVMFKGRIVEIGDTKTVFNNMAHPYTRDLFAAIPSIKTKNLVTEILKTNEIPEGSNFCYYYNRCRFRTEICKRSKPELKVLNERHSAVCHNIL
ncbi:ABC transporter ATP-binding protein [Treponema sp. OMZ 788]|uniref:oligopeptide/dipeptide ABC transporter ATP-binding protein n=1 Tax=unclassified Treponema TaxID=2638727 RepID=UPI0020A4DCAF|nr:MULTISPECIES: ABC transporter ATP-binding protein [unclassified Treponema]UTC62507.1 ABC transporter ATP-binding protein [Treponema sp. OMZ 787]UTC64519.1 ABC transporter ATP-binding protein [Treponema sp. OMZ 788]